MRAHAYRILAGLLALIALADGISHALDFAAPHRMHVLGHTVISAALVVGLASQVLASRSPAGLHLVAVIGGAAALGDVLGRRFGGLEVVCAVALALLVALHPQRRDVVRFAAAPSRAALAAGVVAVVAVLPYLVHQSALQRSQVDPAHPDLGYWSWAAVAPLVLALAVLVAAWRPDGWRLLVVVAASGSVVLGLASLLLPHEPSSFGLVGGAAAVTAGAVLAVFGLGGRTVTSVARRPVPR